MSVLCFLIVNLNIVKMGNFVKLDDFIGKRVVIFQTANLQGRRDTFDSGFSIAGTLEQNLISTDNLRVVTSDQIYVYFNTDQIVSASPVLPGGATEKDGVVQVIRINIGG